MESRIGSGVSFDWDIPQDKYEVLMNVNLFQWVIENLVKNSVDAMEGTGKLQCIVESKTNKVFMDIVDTGKGISRGQNKDIFKPGFTTKKRGWGLGLSLAKRIVEDYHNGLIFVKESTPFKKTVIRVQLDLSNNQS